MRLWNGAVLCVPLCFFVFSKATLAQEEAVPKRQEALVVIKDMVHAKYAIQFEKLALVGDYDKIRSLEKKIVSCQTKLKELLKGQHEAAWVDNLFSLEDKDAYLRAWRILSSELSEDDSFFVSASRVPLLNQTEDCRYLFSCVAGKRIRQEKRAEEIWGRSRSVKVIWAKDFQLLDWKGYRWGVYFPQHYAISTHQLLLPDTVVLNPNKIDFYAKANFGTRVDTKMEDQEKAFMRALELEGDVEKTQVMVEQMLYTRAFRHLNLQEKISLIEHDGLLAGLSRLRDLEDDELMFALGLGRYNEVEFEAILGVRALLSTIRHSKNPFFVFGILVSQAATVIPGASAELKALRQCASSRLGDMAKKINDNRHEYPEIIYDIHTFHPTKILAQTWRLSEEKLRELAEEVYWDNTAAIYVNEVYRAIDRGESLRKQDMLRMADAALGMRGESVYILNRVAGLYRRGERFKKAMELYEKIVKKGPERNEKYATCVHNLGVLKLKFGRLEQAFDLFEEAIKLNPKNISAHKTLGDLYMRKGNKDKAIEMYEVYLKYRPNGDWAKEVREKLRKLGQKRKDGWENGSKRKATTRI